MCPHGHTYHLPTHILPHSSTSLLTSSHIPFHVLISPTPGYYHLYIHTPSHTPLTNAVEHIYLSLPCSQPYIHLYLLTWLHTWFTNTHLSTQPLPTSHTLIPIQLLLLMLTNIHTPQTCTRISYYLYTFTHTHVYTHKHLFFSHTFTHILHIYTLTGAHLFTHTHTHTHTHLFRIKKKAYIIAIVKWYKGIYRKKWLSSWGLPLT